MQPIPEGTPLPGVTSGSALHAAVHGDEDFTTI
jgi:hypothetical protein